MALQQSVPSPSVVQATFAATLFDQWIRLGLRDVVICPGSRSTPLVMACARRDELMLHVRIDERSAGFFAIGRALATHRPVAIVVTSGTAAAELHACVAEAAQAFVPLLVITADRPPELHGVGAPQTIDQHKLFGKMVRRFEEPGVARREDAGSWRTLAERLWSSAINRLGSSGPVHLNAAFVEPLVGEPAALPMLAPPDVDGWGRTNAVLDLAGQRVLCVVGHGATREMVEDCVAMGWVVVGDATAQGALAHFDTLLRSDEFAQRAAPDVVVRLGGLPASKVLQERLRAWAVRMIALTGAGFVADPDRLVTERLLGLPRPTFESQGDASYVELWRGASKAVESWLDSVDAEHSEMIEPLVARLIVTLSGQHGVPLVIGSSMPVRDVEWWAPARSVETYSNRGVNGIDGVVSTTFGVAAGSRAIGLVGDVTLLHDVSGLVDGLGDAGGSCVLVVIDNRGGGIFSFLPQATALDPERFERLFATPRTHDLERIAGAFGHRSQTVLSLVELHTAVEQGLATTGVSVIVARVPSRERNVLAHEELNNGAREALEALQ